MSTISTRLRLIPIMLCTLALSITVTACSSVSSQPNNASASATTAQVSTSPSTSDSNTNTGTDEHGDPQDVVITVPSPAPAGFNEALAQISDPTLKEAYADGKVTRGEQTELNRIANEPYETCLAEHGIILNAEGSPQWDAAHSDKSYSELAQFITDCRAIPTIWNQWRNLDDILDRARNEQALQCLQSKGLVDSRVTADSMAKGESEQLSQLSDKNNPNHDDYLACFSAQQQTK